MVKVKQTNLPDALNHLAQHVVTRHLVASAALWMGLASISAAEEPPSEPDEAMRQFVIDKVQPLFEARCFKCHGPKDQREEEDPGGGLLLTSRDVMLQGGDSGPAIVPGKPDKSLLVDAVNWGDMEMPPDSKLPAGEIAILTRWVQTGAPWLSGEPAAAAEKKAFPLAERRANHWAWQPLSRPDVPVVNDTSWPRDDLDRLVARQREAKKLRPAPDADRRVLIRRMTFALTGLPPTPEEDEAFVDDSAPDDEAIDRLADRLLSSPHFGERWARHWLDLARYAESRGHEFDFPAANAWHYRDYVIRALNQDLPYDQFVTEHIAGDLLPQPRLHPQKGFNESILATGFWYLGDWVHSPTDIRADEADRIDNQIDVFGRALLGLTVACARCHDHKFDAISTKDYYALAGYMQSSAYRQVRFEAIDANRGVARQLWSLRKQTAAHVRKAWGHQLQSGAQGVANYLKAARDVLRQQGSADQLAAGRALDANRLASWVEHLRGIGRNAQDWLIVWSQLAGRPADQDALNAQWRAATEAADAAAARHRQAWEASKLLVDFADLPQSNWRQNGFAFGPSPVRVGDILLLGDAKSPRTGVALYGAARQDLLWPKLTLAPGTEKEPGALEKLNRAGRTLRTPNFTVDGAVHYLVRGKGQLQVVVASHRMIKGPLHGQLVRSFNTRGALQWTTADLARYRGERAHLEFIPAPGETCEILQVAIGSQPPLPEPSTAAVLAWIYEAKTIESEDRLAANYEKLLAEAARTFTDGTIAGAKHPQAMAALVSWMLEHPALLGIADPTGTESTDDAIRRFHQQQSDLIARVRPQSATAIAIWDGEGENEQLLIRGSSKNPGSLVPRRFLEALDGQGPTSDAAGSGRLELAQQVTNPRQNPLLARVMVNRIWHHLMGQGIVPTVDNFGVLGQPPSHPELLDHLATKFIDDGWSIKNTIRRIVTSRTYRMSSQTLSTQAEQIDPDNVYLHRMNLRRLEGEAIRDAMLAISGRLDRTVGGRSVPVYLTNFMKGRGRPKSGPLDGAGRRSIYIAIRRNFLPAMMLAFDMPIPFSPVGRRNVSNVPAQPLILMNDPFVIEQAQLWAGRALRDKALEPESRITSMYRAAFGREATTEEVADAVAFLQQQASEYGIPGGGWQQDPRVWTDFAHVLWNVKEFIFVR